uniref:Uncharacterized protein n=1 Tax=Oryza barthii TaxID=65489 RepID=A0A0D3EXS8_9ORYZ
MQTVLYSEKGSSGDCGDHQMAHLPRQGMFARNEAFGADDWLWFPQLGFFTALQVEEAPGTPHLDGICVARSASMFSRLRSMSLRSQRHWKSAFATALQHSFVGAFSALPTVQYDRHSATADRSTPHIDSPAAPPAAAATTTNATSTTALTLPAIVVVVGDRIDQRLYASLAKCVVGLQLLRIWMKSCLEAAQTCPM